MFFRYLMTAGDTPGAPPALTSTSAPPPWPSTPDPGWSNSSPALQHVISRHRHLPHLRSLARPARTSPGRLAARRPASPNHQPTRPAPRHPASGNGRHQDGSDPCSAAPGYATATQNGPLVTLVQTQHLILGSGRPEGGTRSDHAGAGRPAAGCPSGPVPRLRRPGPARHPTRAAGALLRRPVADVTSPPPPSASPTPTATARPSTRPITSLTRTWPPGCARQHSTCWHWPIWPIRRWSPRSTPNRRWPNSAYPCCRRPGGVSSAHACSTTPSCMRATAASKPCSSTP